MRIDRVQEAPEVQKTNTSRSSDVSVALSHGERLGEGICLLNGEPLEIGVAAV
jgi:hypothetical protein